MSTYDVGEITVYIVADTTGFDRGISRSRDTMNSFQRSMQIAAGVMMRDLFYGFIGAIQEATDLGAEMQTLRNSFEAFTDAAGAQGITLERLRTATMNMVSDVDLLTQANRMLSAGMPIDQIEELFGGAIKLGKAMGIDASMAIEKLTLGLVRQSWRLMDDLGIIMRASQAYKEYAESIGVSTSSLSASQKQTAWQIYGINQLRERVVILRDNIGEADKMLDQFAASMRNLYTAIGENIAAVPVVTTLLNAFAPVVGIVLAQQFMVMSAAASAAGKALTGFQAAAAMGVALSPYLAFAAVIAMLPTSIKGYSMALHDLRMATDDVYAAQERLKQSTDELDKLIQRVDTTASAYEDAQNKVAANYQALLSAVDAYSDALSRQQTIEDDLENALRVKTVAYADFIAALQFARGETEAYHAVQADLTWATRESEMVYLSLQNTLFGLQDTYKALSVEMDALRASDDETTLATMELNLERDKLTVAHNKGQISDKAYERGMKRLGKAQDELRVKSDENRIAQFKLTNQMDDTQNGMTETENSINALIAADDQYEQTMNNVITLQNQLIEATQDLNAAFVATQSSLDIYNQSQIALATAYTDAWMAAKLEALAIIEVDKAAQEAWNNTVKRDEERRKREQEARPPDDTTPGTNSFPTPSVPSLEPTTQGGGGAIGGGNTFNPTSNSTSLQVNIGTVVGTDKATAEKTGEMVIDYVVRGLRTRGVNVR